MANAPWRVAIVIFLLTRQRVMLVETALKPTMRALADRYLLEKPLAKKMEG